VAAEEEEIFHSTLATVQRRGGDAHARKFYRQVQKVFWKIKEAGTKYRHRRVRTDIARTHSSEDTAQNTVARSEQVSERQSLWK
jgi:hypothetical protein